MKARIPPANQAEETMTRLQRIKSMLEEARTLAAGKRRGDVEQAWLICADLRDLYQDYPEARDVLEAAGKLRAQLTQSAEPKP